MFHFLFRFVIAMSIIAAVMVGLSFLLTALSTPVCEYDVEDVEVYENKEGHIKD